MLARDNLARPSSGPADPALAPHRIVGYGREQKMNNSRKPNNYEVWLCRCRGRGRGGRNKSTVTRHWQGFITAKPKTIGPACWRRLGIILSIILRCEFLATKQQRKSIRFPPLLSESRVCIVEFFPVRRSALCGAALLRCAWAGGGGGPMAARSDE